MSGRDAEFRAILIDVADVCGRVVRQLDRYLANNPKT